MSIDKEDSSKWPKIMIATPNRDTRIHALFHIGLIQLVFASKRVHLSVQFDDTLGVDCSRNSLVHKARAQKMDYIFFLDADTVVPPDALNRLLALNVDVASVMYSNRQPPFKIHAYYHVDERDNFVVPTARIDQIVAKVNTPHNYVQVLHFMDVMIVHAVGMGGCLIKMGVFDKVPEPWFKCHFDEQLLKMTKGEDMDFCDKLRPIGIPVYLDTTIKPVLHLSQDAYASNLEEFSILH